MIDRVARAIALLVLRRTRGGELTIAEDGGPTFVFGAVDGLPVLRARIDVHSPRAYTAMLRGSLGLAEARAAGEWSSPDLVALVRLGARNVVRFDELRRRTRWIAAPLQALGRRNTVPRSRRQIAAHYDLGNELYELFLDESLTYSSGLFDRPDASLHDAQIAKIDRACRELDLGPDDHLLEIGTGWGALAIHAAGHYGCRVTTTTISQEQHRLATERVRAAGLADRVTVLRRDYRELTGRYDKLVSIEMIEAVGWRDFGTFFRVCGERLAPGGRMLLQAITIDDDAYEVEKAPRTFINQLIFPGGCLPSRIVVDRCIARETSMRQIGTKDLTGSYVLTLARWRERFQAAAPELGERGYDAPFRRLWDLYLAYSQAGFAERRIEVWQLLFAQAGTAQLAARQAAAA